MCSTRKTTFLKITFELKTNKSILLNAGVWHFPLTLWHWSALQRVVGRILLAHGFTDLLNLGHYSLGLFTSGLHQFIQVKISLLYKEGEAPTVLNLVGYNPRKLSYGSLFSIRSECTDTKQLGICRFSVFPTTLFPKKKDRSLDDRSKQ